MKRDELLGRVLGPDAPELTCEQCFAELDRYVELVIAGEQADERIPGMHAHLEGCPACAEDFRSLRDLVSQQED
ncbi:MAG TPA: hypothetical protein VFT79_05185 [Solirubrobacterales bacterium]|nr:hypothetical protein [Solirubrobacterales bacterium]